MFFFLPVGVEGAALARVPYVSIGLAAACVVGFTATWVLPANPESAGEAEFGAFARYWEEHPHLEVPPDFMREHLGKNAPEVIAERRDLADPPAEGARALEQAELDRLRRAAVGAMEASPLRRWSLVPQRGAAQAGWLTHLFLHLGWMHLLGNLLFFYLVGPLLEEVWGRAQFLAFYLVGGVIAGAAQVAFEPSGMILGASGAIAACIGAFTLRYWRCHIRMAYLVFVFRIWHGTFLVPAWMWGLFWFGSEVYALQTTGGHSGVAVMAHLGGFACGFATAAGLQFAGIGLPAPELTAPADGAGDDPQAALARDPSDVDALVAVARGEFDAGRRDAGMARAERAVRLLLNKRDDERLFRLLHELSGHFEAQALHPQLAAGLCAALDRGPAWVQPLREPALLRAGDAATDVGAQALVRVAELRLRRGEDAGAREVLLRARAIPGLPPARTAAIEALLAPLTRPVEAPPAVRPPRLVRCRLVAVTGDALTLDAGGRQVSLPLGQLRSIRAALVAQAPAPALVTDLLVAGQRGAPATQIRLEVQDLRLADLFPGAAARETYPRLIAHLARRSGAPTAPPLEAIARGAFPQFPSREALDAAALEAPEARVG